MATGLNRNHDGRSVDGFGRSLWNGNHSTWSSWGLDWVEYLSDFHDSHCKYFRLDRRGMEGHQSAIKICVVEWLVSSPICDSCHNLRKSLSGTVDNENENVWTLKSKGSCV